MQDNYRTFTHSKIKFPNPKEMFDALHDWGFKCSTNITPIISCNTDENGEYSPYKALDTGKANGMFVINTREDGSGTHDPYIGNVNYGRGHLTWGHYPDLGRQDVQKWWGEQYRDLLDWGLDFVWQDMTTPAMKASVHQPDCTLLSFPMDIMITDNEETRLVICRQDGVLTPPLLLLNQETENIFRVSHRFIETRVPFGRTRNAVGTRAASECFHSFFEFSQTFTNAFITR